MDWNPAPWQTGIAIMLVIGWMISIAHDLNAIRKLLQYIADKLSRDDL